MTQTSAFTYDDGTPSTVAYTTNAAGEVLSRIESSSAASNPQSYYYFFDGQQVGEIDKDRSPNS